MCKHLVVALVLFSGVSEAGEVGVTRMPGSLTIRPIPTQLASVKLDEPTRSGFLHYNGTPLTDETLKGSIASGAVPGEEAKRMLSEIVPDVPKANAGIDVHLYKGLVAEIVIYVYDATAESLKESLTKQFGGKTEHFFSEDEVCNSRSLIKWNGEFATLLFISRTMESQHFIIIRSNKLYPQFAAKRGESEGECINPTTLN